MKNSKESKRSETMSVNSLTNLGMVNRGLASFRLLLSKKETVINLYQGLEGHHKALEADTVTIP